MKHKRYSGPRFGLPLILAGLLMGLGACDAVSSGEKKGDELQNRQIEVTVTVWVLNGRQVPINDVDVTYTAKKLDAEGDVISGTEKKGSGSTGNNLPPCIMTFNYTVLYDAREDRYRETIQLQLRASKWVGSWEHWDVQDHHLDLNHWSYQTSTDGKLGVATQLFLNL